jgi:hypothetical protein
MNANCPGSYAHAGIRHPDAPEFAGTPIQLGGASSTAAQIWGTLPQWVLDRSCFIHARHAQRGPLRDGEDSPPDGRDRG